MDSVISRLELLQFLVQDSFKYFPSVLEQKHVLT